MLWNDDWRSNIKIDEPECYERLGCGTNTKKDLPIIATYIHKENPHRTKEECLDRAIYWVTDLNGQISILPDDEEYKKLLAITK